MIGFSWRSQSSGLALFLVALLLSLSCAREETDSGRRPTVLVGVDGASWIAIEDLWAQGRLPNLRVLADRGVTSKLKPIADISPVIWTSMVTGVKPATHGIEDFLLPTDRGDIPVSSSVRRVPALWNMLSTADKRVAVLGWWASWPAEPVNGVVVTDRALRGVENGLYPESLSPRFQEIADRFPQPTESGLQAEIARQDSVLGELARQLVDEDFDLILVYIRSPDIVSHPYWKYFQPPEGEEISQEKIERFGELVPAAYESFDRILGQLVDAAPQDTNFFVVSDHGFTAVEGEQYRMLVDLNRVLEHMGYLVRVDGEIDWSRTRAVTWNSPPGVPEKMVRFGLADRDPAGPVRPGDLDALREELATDLRSVVHRNGAPLFGIRQPSSAQLEKGADLTVVVHKRKRPSKVFFHDQEIPGVMQSVEELTGTHSAKTKGIFIAAGPDIDPTFSTPVVHTFDITPTLLYSLNLPIAEDFDGKARVGLFNPEFRAANPLTTIPTWGKAKEGSATASDIDTELVEELRALGYLD
jgi:predicted AlkP superfamily phosphohydrolase/phosphomutase